MSDPLETNLKQIRILIEEAAQSVGRDPGSVRLLPASKTQPVEVLRRAYELGLDTFAENRVQEGRIKVPMMPSACHWHFIGGLQRNKVKEAVRLFEVIHSLDSESLIEEVGKRAAEQGKQQKVLVEVNVAGEASKHGASPDQLAELVARANDQDHLEVIGLMTVAPFYEDLEKVRPYFARLRELRDGIQQAQGIFLPELSMGMSHDFQVAIEEGATWVRIGSSLFGARSYTSPA